ncbi:PREDICTED: F-box/kelch-repeat protein At3g04660-like [Camelina sativa]|uniref:F-box/kelch-repeat protein At3g04660-like n=1 Tax=Camelina sativa TaxID=90675 RepID=A0ABM0VI31_CAMSA|nr:PREDICTED: F-box/kelch-repeat protein At3g04660-like [Camelina sativa]
MERVTKINDPQKRDGGPSFSLPEDLIIEILLNLPAKSIPKLVVVSKLWSSIIRSKHFIDIYLEQSLTRPCFLISFHRDSIRFFDSIPLQSLEAASPSSSYTSTTSSFPLSLNTRLYPLSYNVSPPVRGLICFQDLDRVAVSNPSTGQFLVLPKLNTRRRGISRFLGYDPVKDEYKVLCMTVSQVSGPVVSEEHQVFTLGGGAQKKEKEEATWRMIECKVPHCPATKGICLTTNGVIYYGAWSTRDRATRGSLIVCFDVRLEEFTLVKLPNGVEIDGGDTDQSELVNYQGKIALLNNSWVQNIYYGRFDMWVLEDFGVKPEWSKISIVVPSWNDFVGKRLFDCRGAILSSGNFIFSPVYSDSPFCIISYDREKDIGRKVVIEGLGNNLCSVSVFLDHVECPILL